MEARRSPTLELAKSLGLAVIHPSPQCDTIDHWRRPATHWINMGGRTPAWLKACDYCAANARATGLELAELTDHHPPQGIQEQLPL